MLIARKKPAAVVIGAIAAVVILTARARGDDWPGFRGGTHQGVASTGDFPADWDLDTGRNIAWRASVPGLGHSSPVVSQGLVIVTSAYSGPRATAAHALAPQLTSVLSAAAALLLGVLIALDVRQSEERPRSAHFHLARGLFLGLTGFLSLQFVHYGAELFDYSRCPIRAWLGPHLAMALAFSMALAAVIGRPWLRRTTAGLLVLIGLSIVVCVPAKSHVYREGVLGPQSLVVVSCAIAPVILASAMFALRTGMLPGGAETPARRWAAHAVLLSSLVFLLVCLARILATPFAEHLIAEQRAFDFFPAWELRRLAIAGAAALAAALGAAWVARRANQEYSFEPFGRVVQRRSAKVVMIAATAGLLLAAAGEIVNAILHRCSFLQYHLPPPNWQVISPTPLQSDAAWLLAGTVVVLALDAVRTRSNRELTTALWAAVAVLGPVHLWDNFGTHQEMQFLRAVTALDEATGRVRWTWEGLAAPREVVHRENSHATPTVAVEGNVVVAHFGGAGLVGLDLESGEQLWVHPAATYSSVYGAGASPVIAAGRVILVIDSPQQPQLLAYDLKSGQLAWRHDRSEFTVDVDAVSGHSSTPLMIELPDGPALVVWGWDRLVVYGAETGTILAEHLVSGGGGDRVASATSDAGQVYLGNPRELIALTRDRLLTSGAACSWRVRASSNCVTPLAFEGQVFLCSDGGVVQCLDSATGERTWRHRLPGEFRSSPIIAGGRLFLGSLEGAMWILDLQDPTPRWREAACGGPVFASPAAVHERLLIRTENELFAVQSDPGQDGS